MHGTHDPRSAPLLQGRQDHHRIDGTQLIRQAYPGHAQHYRSRILLPLSAGFLILVLLILVHAINHERLIDSQFAVIDRTASATEKMHLIASLIEAARARTRLTGQMLVTEDIFDRDDINLRLDQLAARFATLRQSLLDMDLTASELEAIRRQNTIIPEILKAQRSAAELAMDNETLKQAKRILYEEVIPGQGEIVDIFMGMMSTLKDEMRSAARAAQQQHQEYQKIQSRLLAFFLALSALVAFLTTRYVYRTECTLQQEKEQAKTTLLSIGDAVVVINRTGIIQSINPVVSSLLGVASGELIGQPLRSSMNLYNRIGKEREDDKHLSYYAQFSMATGSRVNLSDNAVLSTTDGREFLLDLVIAPIALGHRVMGAVITFRDVTAQKHLTRKLAYHAQHDSLTGFLNRRTFEEACEGKFTRLTEGETHCFCVVDLDHFKAINDSCGHKAGDEVLRKVAQIMRDSLRSQDLIARIGGDEFTLYLEHCSEENALKLMHQLNQRVSDYRYLHQDKDYSVSCSIGIVAFDRAPENFGRIFNTADTACYLAKEQGRSRCVALPLDSKRTTTLQQQVNWPQRIEQGLREDRFFLEFQDLAPLSPNADKMCEALIRYRDDTSIVHPQAFLPVAERHDLIGRLDALVVQKVVTALRSGQIDGLVCINISGKTLSTPELYRPILAYLEQETDFDHRRLCIEVTENEALRNLQEAQAFLGKVRELGCQASLDDFGSSMHALARLDKLPLDFIKLDGEFIQQLPHSEHSLRIVQAVAQISRASGLRSVAEFVDSEEILDKIRDLEIDYAQGFFINRPHALSPEAAADRPASHAPADHNRL